MTKSKQILKVCGKPAQKILVEDKKPVAFVPAKDSKACLFKKNTPISASDLRSHIEPWLTALCQSDHLSLLVGSGLTTAMHKIVTGCPPKLAEASDFGAYSDAIAEEANRSAESHKREKGNIEDQIRAANNLLLGLDILALRESGNDSELGACELRKNLSNLIAKFTDSILKAERNIIVANENDGERKNAFNTLVSFLMSFASRTATRERLHIFTTNYDRVIEAGAELSGLHLLDRFVGNLSPIFRSSRLDLDLHYNPPGIRGEPRYLEGVARFTKLHGSLDWADCSPHIRRMGIPFGANDFAPYLHQGITANDSEATRLMIYPNAAKDRETTEYPFVELFRDFAAAICRPNHTLVTYGYGFGDEHINRIIEDMLTIPSTHLVIISYSDPSGRIATICKDIGRDAQISMLIGDHIGDLNALVKHYLPKPAIDLATARMAALLKARFDSATRRDSSRGKS